MSTNYVSLSPAVSTRLEDDPRWTPPRAAVHAALTLQFAADMYKLLECTWIVAMNAERGVLYPLAALGAHPEPPALAPEPSLTCNLLVHGRTAGALALGPKRNSDSYTPADQSLLAETAVQIGALLENERLSWHLAAKILEAERTRRELETAREVRNRFFPTRFSAVKGIDYYGECEPCDEIAGDFFDLTPLPGSGLAIAIGSVSGRGVPAAIMVTALQAALRSISAKNGDTPAQVVAELNRLVCDLCPDDFYATLFYARIYAGKSSLTYANAGHEPALLLRPDARRLYRLNVGGTVLGLTRQSSYQQDTIPLHGGDVLLAHTDGIAEEDHGADRIASCLRTHPDITARDLVTEVLRAGIDFHDRTAVAARIARTEAHAPLFAVAPWERERMANVVAA